MESITGADIRTTLVVLSAIVAMLVAVLSLVKLLRAEKERSAQPLNEVRNKVNEHETRLAKLESASASNVTENKLMMKMQLALVRHAIDGNNVDGLREMREEVQNYLVNK